MIGARFRGLTLGTTVGPFENDQPSRAARMENGGPWIHTSGGGAPLSVYRGRRGRTKPGWRHRTRMVDREILCLGHRPDCRECYIQGQRGEWRKEWRRSAREGWGGVRRGGR